MLCFLVSFQSTHPLRGATQRLDARADLIQISIHAPLAGCDLRDFARDGHVSISIHAPLAGCDRTLFDAHSDHVYFNPRTPCGVRLDDTRQKLLNAHFNPRTPCGVRPFITSLSACLTLFQSTHPLRGATVASTSTEVASWYFNPRTPCGVRLPVCTAWLIFANISIHAPLAGCDAPSLTLIVITYISIHAPLAGCDFSNRGGFFVMFDFNPRTPCGVRPCRLSRRRV